MPAERLTQRSTSRPLLLGHRGARALKSVPENTLPSFDQALADGCDGFEFDVRLTADHKAVVCHDAHSGGLEIAQTPAHQLSALPQLQEMVVRYRDRAFLDIELKVVGIEEIVLDLLQKHPPQRGFVISSFLPEVLQTVHLGDSTVPLGLICETPDELRRWRRLPIEYVIPHHKLVNGDLIREFRAAGKKILVWTVNRAEHMRRLAVLGVDGIISDDTNLLSSTLQ